MLSEKGKPLLVVGGAKFYLAQQLKCREVKWRCVQKLCTAKIYMDAGCNRILKEDKGHNHAVKEETLARQKINNSVKLKARAELKELPRRLITSEIRSFPDLSERLTSHDIYNIRKTMYNARRSRGKSAVKSGAEDVISSLAKSGSGAADSDGEYLLNLENSNDSSWVYDRFGTFEGRSKVSFFLAVSWQQEW